MTDQHEYILANATDEENRLLAQGRVLDSLTRRLFSTAELSPGMRVLDLGSGAGSVAMIAASSLDLKAASSVSITIPTRHSGKRYVSFVREAWCGCTRGT